MELSDREFREWKTTHKEDVDVTSVSYSAGGIWPCIVGTGLLVIGSMTLALFIGISCAIYLSEYSRDDRFIRLIRVAILNLAGVPSIVFGLFGFGLFVIFFGWNVSLLSGWFTLGLMVLPAIITASEESLRAVPQGLREGSLALGATKWQTIRKNVLPYALPGILTSSILGIARVAGETAPIMFTAAYAMRDLDFAYGANTVLHNVTLDIPAQAVTAFIGPSGCGKTTLLRCINRMNDLIEGARITRGAIHLGGIDINAPEVDVVDLRRRVGMIFQKSNPFPKSVYENISYGLRIAVVNKRTRIDEAVEKSLRAAALWDEVKDRLDANAFGLSGGQQQRLCIARALAVEPDVVLMDEPCSALDPIATAKIEELIHDLRTQYTIAIVTHNMQQAGRVSDHTGFFYLGKLIEFGPTTKIFTNPSEKRTEDYITGRFG